MGKGFMRKGKGKREQEEKNLFFFTMSPFSLFPSSNCPIPYDLNITFILI
jgi:hypothetical protein